MATHDEIRSVLSLLLGAIFFYSFIGKSLQTCINGGIVLSRFIMGQNLAAIWSSASLDNDQDSDFPGRIRKWFDEVKKYSYGARFSLTTGHYMQLVWAESFLVGCGYSYYYSANKYNKLYVCNYGPGGNIQGQQPYLIGRPSCDQHGLQKSHKYPSLCMPRGMDRYHHDNTIPENYYSYPTLSDSHGNQHFTAASTPMVVYTAVANGLSHLSHDGHILYNLVFDQHKQQQYHYHPTGQQTTQQPTYHHLSNPLAPIATTATAALLKPTGDALKSPFLTYRWDLLFNFLH
ncbi:peptidase inhibitor 16 isoform X2 [Wyeomyia smithii]|uniref:peptidase inhibitor 16 isoform X2 n=1 Tax=Wyeomyia smithii TaxID=174621 RepID=UPI0024681026|nr:peptidase inhibitor 16 isoform X2 [Wyeomyia smithii]